MFDGPARLTGGTPFMTMFSSCRFLSRATLLGSFLFAGCGGKTSDSDGNAGTGGQSGVEIVTELAQVEKDHTLYVAANSHGVYVTQLRPFESGESGIYRVGRDGAGWQPMSTASSILWASLVTCGASRGCFA